MYWIAKDKLGNVEVFFKKPEKIEDRWISQKRGKCRCDNLIGEELSWEDKEPSLVIPLVGLRKSDIIEFLEELGNNPLEMGEKTKEAVKELVRKIKTFNPNEKK